MKAAVLCEITRNDGHWAVQNHSRSPILAPIESEYQTSNKAFIDIKLRAGLATPQGALSALEDGSKSDFFRFLSRSQRLIVSSAVNLVRR